MSQPFWCWDKDNERKSDGALIRAEWPDDAAVKYTEKYCIHNAKHGTYHVAVESLAFGWLRFYSIGPQAEVVQ